MKNKNTFLVKCSEAGKRGAYERWKCHTPSKWTSLRVSFQVKNQIMYSCHQYGFKSVDQFLYILNDWSGEIMKRRAAVLEKRKKN